MSEKKQLKKQEAEHRLDLTPKLCARIPQQLTDTPDDICSLKLYPTHTKHWHRPSHRYSCHSHQHKAYWGKAAGEKKSSKQISNRCWKAAQKSTGYVSKPSESSYRFRASKAQSLTVGKKKTRHQEIWALFCGKQPSRWQDKHLYRAEKCWPGWRKQPLAHDQGQEVQVSNRQSECEQHQLIAKLLGLKTVLAVPRLTTQSGIRGNYTSRVIINCSS